MAVLDPWSGGPVAVLDLIQWSSGWELIHHEKGPLCVCASAKKERQTECVSPHRQQHEVSIMCVL